MSREFVLSLSLGAGGAPSGLTVIEPKTQDRTPEGPWHDRETIFEVVWLERFGPDRSYPAIGARVAEIDAQRQLGAHRSLLVDITETGKPPLKIFDRRGQYAHALQIVGAVFTIPSVNDSML